MVMVMVIWLHWIRFDGDTSIFMYQAETKTSDIARQVWAMARGRI